MTDIPQKFDFDRIIDRRDTDSIKWCMYGPDVLPMWVADMDFLSPPAVIDALRARVERGVFGYPRENQELSEVIVERLRRLYGWEIQTDWVIHLPGVITGFNLACQAFARPGEGILIQTPVYTPILHAPETGGFSCNETQLVQDAGGRYEVDFDAFEAAITGQTRVFLLCNPHNPVGRDFHREELEKMAEICLRRGVILVSDEIHSDLLFSETRHVPIASLSPEVAARSVTLMSASKTYNIAGLQSAFAVIPDQTLRKEFIKARRGLIHWVNLMATTAVLAAYRESQDWLDELLVYLEGNRDFLVHAIRERFPRISMRAPEATYLAWLDCRRLPLNESAFFFFLREARVALVDGAGFGKGGEGFARLNFGCPRSVLKEALDRMEEALFRLEQKTGELPRG
ncbi:MAG TPA: PatB family C-S lyase [Anaerolineaceae bacterium]|nr:PatB family C-S lyase [Anaerolineaceae bacterium]